MFKKIVLVLSMSTLLLSGISFAADEDIPIVLAQGSEDVVVVSPCADEDIPIVLRQ